MLKIYAINKKLYSADKLFKDYENCLSKEKIIKLQSYKDSNSMLSSLLGELLAKVAISKNFNIDINKINFGKIKNGKPVILNFDNIFFNISHSENQVICGISNSVIGIDIEHLDRKINIKALSKRFFSEEEEIYIKNSFDFLKIWTLKEAYLKAVGIGISGGLKNFTVPLNKNNKMSSNNKDWYFDSIKYDNYIISVCQNKKIENKIEIEEISI